MNIDKAIEILTYSVKHNTLLITQDDKDAVSLGIEALKEVKESRFDPSSYEPRILPGETED